MPAPTERCPYCGQPLVVIRVHGHGQCAACGTEVESCCNGEQAQPDDGPADGAHDEREEEPPRRSAARRGPL